MTPAQTIASPGTGLRGRDIECQALDQLITGVREGHGRALVLHGEAGVGKTALLDYLSGRASSAGCRVVRAVCVRSETGLAFAGIHQLGAPVLAGSDQLPNPQRDALRIALGLTAESAPDAFLVGLAMLSLLGAAAGDRPLICVIDDEQWLDRASAQALGFAARRLRADPVGLVFASRAPGAELAGLPAMELRGLAAHDARALLDSALAGPLDPRIRDLIVAETRGNPLALLELPRGLTPAELAGGFGLLDAVSLPGQTEQDFARQLAALPAETRQLVQLAAADTSGDQSLLWRAARRLGISFQAAWPATESGLVEFGAVVRFRHPRARSAAYQSAPLAERQRMHAALANATDPATDPDRRAWHLARALPGPDEEVALELERCAGRAQARGGHAAAGAFLERAVLLTVDLARHAERILAAASASHQAGAFGKALELLDMAEAGSLDEFQQARVRLLRGQVAFASGLSSDDATARLLLQAARELEPFDRPLAREAHLAAWNAAIDAGPAAAGEVRRGARTIPAATDAPRPLDLLVDGFARLVTDGHAAAAATLQCAAQELASMPVADVLRCGWLTPGAYLAVWDFEGLDATCTRQVRLAREAGALPVLPIHLSALAIASTWRGDFATAAALITEAESVAAATGSRIAPFAALRLDAMRGREPADGFAAASGEGQAALCGHWAAAALSNGLGHFEKAASAAQRATASPFDPWVSVFALPELIEAAARLGDTDLANDGLARLVAAMPPGDNDSALGVKARCQALLSHGTDADDLYREAIDRLGRTRLRPELARAHLLYGEWLRQEGRLADARGQLRAAHDELTDIGMEAFAERARRELLAAGEKVRRYRIETVTVLTAQEALIAGLARDGRTNPEIGAQLFLSARTVEWHLRKVFTKLGIGSRRELHTALV